MSWFKRRPRVKEPPKQTPQHTSPLTRKLLKEQQDAVKPKKDSSI
jgi:hypothetical protein